MRFMKNHERGFIGLIVIVLALVIVAILVVKNWESMPSATKINENASPQESIDNFKENLNDAKEKMQDQVDQVQEKINEVREK